MAWATGTTCRRIEPANDIPPGQLTGRLAELGQELSGEEGDREMGRRRHVPLGTPFGRSARTGVRLGGAGSQDRGLGPSGTEGVRGRGRNGDCLPYVGLCATVAVFLRAILTSVREQGEHFGERVCRAAAGSYAEASTRGPGLAACSILVGRRPPRGKARRKPRIAGCSPLERGIEAAVGEEGWSVGGTGWGIKALSPGPHQLKELRCDSRK